MSKALDSQTDRASHWSITINNPTDEDRQLMRTEQRWLRFVRGQDEIAPTTGTLHIQAYANTDQVRKRAVQDWLPRAHVKPCITKDHITNVRDIYVSKDRTAVADTQFEINFRKDNANRPLTMSQTLTSIAEFAFSQEFINKEMTPEYDDKGIVIRKALTMKEVLEKEFWHAVNMMLTTNSDLVGLLTQPQYMRAWVNTRQVWVNKFVVDSQTSIRVLDDGSISPVSV